MRDFWLRSPIYIVICVLLGFVIAGLLAQNVQLKNDLDDLKTEQREQQAKTEDVKRQADRIIAYLRCVSLTPVGERTEELINKCLTQDLPPQGSNGTTQSGGGTSFLEPAPQTGQPSGPVADGGQPVDNSTPNTPNTPNNPDPETPGRDGLLAPITNPLCTNLTPRVCATLGL